MRASWFGRAMRATAQNPAAARLIGIDAELMYRLAFALGVGLTAFGGAVILPYVTVYPGVGGQFVVLMFTVVVLGGLGSVAGAVVGGLAVGVIQSLSALFFPIQLQNLVLFVVFILVLAVRPQGLVGASR
jgi:branched-chain amino acid transport system permease protein